MNRTLPLLFALLPLVSLPARAEGPLQRREDRVPAQVNLIYQKGLEYLAETQQGNGSWESSSQSLPGVVGFCVTAFLANGDDPAHGKYALHIRRGIDAIIASQNASNGYIGNSMYNHAFATMGLAEAYGMVPHPEIAPSLQRAVEHILSAQKRNPKHAWRYTPVLAARNAGIPVPQDAILKGLNYLAKNRGLDGSYGYTSPSGGKPTLTAIGMLCLSLAHEDHTKPFQKSLEYLQKNLDYRERHYPYYFEYYMSQALFHADEATWEEWNQRNIRYMATLQNSDGSFPGNQGKAFSTAGALLSLALNYRFLPIYEK